MTLLQAIKREIPNTEVASEQETRNLLRTLAFKFGHLHSDHYHRIANRADVRYHRGQYAPFLLSMLNSDRIWMIHGDASFANKDAHSSMGWFSLDEKDDDLIGAGTGVGGRLNMFEFLTKEGILWHPDGILHTFPFATRLIAL